MNAILVNKILREIIYELVNKSTIHKVHESLINMPLGEFDADKQKKEEKQPTISNGKFFRKGNIYHIEEQ